MFSAKRSEAKIHEAKKNVAHQEHLSLQAPRRIFFLPSYSISPARLFFLVPTSHIFLQRSKEKDSRVQIHDSSMFTHYHSLMRNRKLLQILVFGSRSPTGYQTANLSLADQRHIFVSGLPQRNCLPGNDGEVLPRL